MYILLLLGIILLWNLQKYIYKKIWDKNVSVQLEFADSHIYEGDRSVLKEIVVNDKRFPLPALHVRLIIPREFIFDAEVSENTTVSDQTYKRDVFSFLGRQQITRKLGFTCNHRGHYQLTGVDLIGSDFFFQENGYRAVPQDADIYVFPKQISTNRIQMLCKEISGTVVAQNRLHPDPFEFSGIRDYEKTDPMNHVNWKASARMGSLMVNQYDSTTNINVTILLDVEDSHILSRERLVEECIRIASSLAGKMAGRRMPVRITSNAKVDTKGEDSAAGLNMYLPAGAGRILELNQRLACIDSDQLTCYGVDFLQQVIEEHVSTHTYILLSQNTSKEMQEKAAILATADNQVIWACPEYRDEDPVEPKIPNVRFLRWEVERW